MHARPPPPRAFDRALGVTDVDDHPDALRKTVGPGRDVGIPPSLVHDAVHAQPGRVPEADLDRIERLVNLVGELVINQSMLSQSIAEVDMTANPKIAAGTSAQSWKTQPGMAMPPGPKARS